MYTNSFRAILTIFFVTLCVLLVAGAEAGELQSLQTEDVEVFFDASLRPAAKEVLHLYPIVRQDLESLFAWKLHLKPSVLLIKTRKDFLKISGDSLVVAFADPQKNLIVIDNSKMIQHPFSLANTLKHEVAHLLLHQYIRADIFPRWLDEGLCQWASDGIGEVIRDPKSSLLNRAAFSSKFIRLRELQQGFPPDKRSRLLAYEESKSFVAYLAGRFGREIIFKILHHMESGLTAETAIQTASFIPFEVLEKEWRHSVSKQMTWFALLSYYLYEILFALMALITIYAFIRRRIKKKHYWEDEPENA
jgi:hypothetical protein